MATVTGLTAARMKQLSDAYIVDATVNTVGNLILTTAGGTSIDAGPVILYGTVNQYYRGDKTWRTLDKDAVGLSNVDNVSVVNNYVPKWAPNTTYLANDLVLSPYGQLLRANSTLLSPATFSTTGWTNVTSGPPTVRTNLATNPAMKGYSAAATALRTNLVTNPSSNGSSTTGWTAARGTITATATAIAGIVQKYFRVTLTDVVGGAYFQRADMSGLPVTAGLTYAISLWMRVSGSPRQAGAQLIFLDASSAQVGTSLTVGTVSNNSSTKISAVAVAPTGATQAIIRVGVTTQTSWAIGDYFEFGAVQLEASGIVDTYIDGAVAASGDFSYAWSGTAYASASQQKALQTTGAGVLAATSGAAYHYKQTSDAPPGHTDSVKAVWTQASTGGSAGITYNTTVSGVAGDVITAKVWVKFDQPRTVKLLVRPRLTTANMVTDPSTSVAVPANTWTELSMTVVATGAYNNILIWPLPVSPGYTFAAGSWMAFGKALIEKASSVGDYFDGASASSDDVFYGWSGAVNGSFSTATPVTTVPKWRAGKSYVAGEQVVSPNNEIVSSKTDRVSGSAWNGTEAANWSGLDQVMNFSSSGFTWGGGLAAWDAGVLSVDTSAASSSQRNGSAFATPGSLSGTVKFTEPGLYDAIWDTGPNAEPGNCGYAVNSSGTWPGPIDGFNGNFAREVRAAGMFYWETKVKAIGIRVPTANLEIRFVGAQANGSTNIARIKIIKRGSI